MNRLLLVFLWCYDRIASEKNAKQMRTDTIAITKRWIKEHNTSVKNARAHRKRRMTDLLNEHNRKLMVGLFVGFEAELFLIGFGNESEFRLLILFW